MFLIANIEAQVSLDCNHGVCPQTQGAVTCTITDKKALWYSSLSNEIATVSSGEVIHFGNTGFIAALVSVNNPGITTNLSFIATTDKNGTQVRCKSRNSMMNCTIMISGMSVTNSVIYN